MRIAIATPAPPGTTRGNRRTAQRYATLLRQLGHTVRVVERWAGGDHDLLIALHASKSHASIAAFARAHPERPIVLVLTGTDVYGGLLGVPRAQDSLRRATRIVTLQPEALRLLDRGARAKATSVLQAAEAAPIAAIHAGEALDAAHGRRARALSKRGSRWRWTGPCRHACALKLLGSADAFVQTSIAEGGSIALAEAVVSGLPVLVTRISAAIGMLGPRHPGYFPVGDARALARLLGRLETDSDFRDRLERASRRLAPRFAPDKERAAWRALLARL
ncbi:MAG: glycosyltransferase [Planctomycetota bacterium]|nr:glycosyltransferase [Planctomycetota bacterium]